MIYASRRNKLPKKEQPDVKIVISLREDFVGALEEFTLAIPYLFHERLRLKPLTEEGARDAITKPAELVANEGEEPFWAAPFSFEKPALDALIAYLEGGSKVIEPFTLQLLCRHAEAIAHSKGGKCEGLVSLSLAYFNEGKDFAQVLKNFYQDALGRVEETWGGGARDNAEELCEHGLLDREGHRLLLSEGQIRDQFGVDDEALNTLVHERLVRRERRAESTFYEIAHDRLAELIYASRRNKLPRKEQEQRQREQEQILREQKQIQREQAQKLREQELLNQNYKWATWASSAVACFLALLIFVALFYSNSQRAFIVASELNLVRNDATSLRDRLLALVDASKKSDSIGTRIALSFVTYYDLKEANEILKDILLRSPIFGWKAPATLNPDETSVTYLSYSGDALSGGMIGVDLPKYLPTTISKHSDLSLLAFPLSSEPIPVPLGGIAGSGAPGDRPSLPTIGFIVPVGDKAQAPLPALVVSPRSLSVAPAIFSKDTGPLGPSCADSWDNGNFLSPIRSDADQNSVLFITSQGAVKQMDISIGAFGRGMPFPPQVDFGNNSLRVMSMSNKGGLPSTLCLLLFEATGNEFGDAAGIAFKAKDGFPKQIAGTSG